jgi:hypothetical protein
MSKQTQDADHLRLLSIFHYVVGALAALFACIPFLHLFIGIAMVEGWGDFASEDEVSGVMGWFFIVFSGAFILAGWAFAVCLAFAGRFLARRRRYYYCLVMAGIACMFMPFGTVLGVFTIIVLLRESVKELFGEGEVPVAQTAEASDSAG